MEQSPTPAELEALSIDVEDGPAPLPMGPEGTPDPTPEILERAARIVSGMGEGAAFSTQSEVLGIRPVATTDIQSDASRLQFLAYILDDIPYVEVFSFFDDRLTFTFSTITADADKELAIASRAASDPDLDYQERFLRASLIQVVRDHQVLDTSPETLGRETYILLKQSFESFQVNVERLLLKAQDKSFWQTP